MVYDAQGQGARLLGRLLRQGPVPRLHRARGRRLRRQGLGLRLRRQRRSLLPAPHRQPAAPRRGHPGGGPAGREDDADPLRPQPARRQARAGRWPSPGPAAGNDHAARSRPRPTRPAPTCCAAARRSGPPQATLDGMAYRLTTPEGSSNPIFLGFTDDPDRRRARAEQRPRSRPRRCRSPARSRARSRRPATSTSTPSRAKKGEKIVVEMFGERQSGLIDPFLAGFDPTGKRLFSGDDAGRNIGQLRFTTNDARRPLGLHRAGRRRVHRAGARPVLPAARRAAVHAIG